MGLTAGKPVPEIMLRMHYGNLVKNKNRNTAIGTPTAR